MLPLWFVIFPLPAFRASSVFLVELLQSFTSLEFMKPIKNRNLDGKNYYFIPPGLFSRMFLYAGRVHPLVCSNACRLSQQPRRTLLHLHQTAALFPSDLRTYIHNREIISMCTAFGLYTILFFFLRILIFLLNCVPWTS